MINKEEVKNILITRTDRLGDVILTLPLVSFARSIFRNAKIFFFVRKYIEELIYDHKDIDEVIIEESLDGFMKKYEYFKKKNLDLVINVKPEFDLALIFFMLGIKYRIGTGYRWYSFLYNYKVYEHRKTSEKHESEYNLNLLRNFFGNEQAKIEFHFKYTKEEFEKLNQKLITEGFELPETYIIIHPGSGGSAKDISIGKLEEFANLFLKDYENYKIVFTGVKVERDLISRVVNKLNSKYENRTLDLSGKLELKELLILIDNSRLFISNSTGPIHIAGALNKNIIGFYPTEKPMNKERWGPLSDNAIILQPRDSNDMNSISAEDILNSARKLIKS